MRLVLVTLFLLGNIFSTFAEGNGGYSGAFLRLGLGARAIAMGNAQVGTAEDGFGFFYNAAALPLLEKISANFSYSFLSLDRRFSYVGISLPLKPQAGFSLGWIYSGVGNIVSYNSRGEQSGEIDHGLHAVYFSFGLSIIPNRLTAGISAKYLLENLSDPEIDYDGKGFGADLAVMLKATRSLSIGYQIKDINGKLKSNTNNIFERGLEKENKFPISHRLGFHYVTPVSWARIAYDFEWSTAGEEKNHFGIEFLSSGVAGRLGYDNDHLTVGAGLEIDRFFGIKAILDYAFVDSVIDEGTTHVFSWQFAF